MKKPVIVIGAGGHARAILETLIGGGMQILGVTDRDLGLKGSRIFDIPVLGGDDEIEKHDPDEIELVNAIGSVKASEGRKRVYEGFRAKGYVFRTVVHPSAIVSVSAQIGNGTHVMPGVVVMPFCRVGENCILNTRCSVDHDVQLGDHVHVAPGATLSGGVVVGGESHLGTGSVVVQNVKIGSRVTVAAGAVVYRDVPDDMMVFEYQKTRLRPR